MDPVTNGYIESIIKANQTGTPDPNRTSGLGLRELIKKIRNQLDEMPSSLAELDDVAGSAPESNQLLRYNGALGKWVSWSPNFVSDLSDYVQSGTLLDDVGIIHSTLLPPNVSAFNGRTGVVTPPG